MTNASATQSHLAVPISKWSAFIVTKSTEATEAAARSLAAALDISEAEARSAIREVIEEQAA